MNEKLIERLNGNALYGDRTLLSASEAREIVSALEAKPDRKRIKELQAEIKQLQADLDEAWKMMLPL